MRYTELQIRSDLLDQPKFRGEPKKVFLLSAPRSGSYLLCRHMINAGLGVPHEYSNPVITRQIAPQLGLADAVSELEWAMPGRGDLFLLRRGERAVRTACSEAASPYETESRLPSKEVVTAAYLAHVGESAPPWPGVTEVVRMLTRR